MGCNNLGLLVSSEMPFASLARLFSLPQVRDELLQRSVAAWRQWPFFCMLQVQPARALSQSTLLSADHEVQGPQVLDMGRVKGRFDVLR